MYEVKYYTLGISKSNRKVGNIKLGENKWFTELEIEKIEKTLIEKLDKKNYFPVITCITKIKGHL